MRSEGYCSSPVCVCVCVFVLICRLIHWNHKSKVPKDSSQYGNNVLKGDLAKMLHSEATPSFLAYMQSVRSHTYNYMVLLYAVCLSCVNSHLVKP